MPAQRLAMSDYAGGAHDPDGIYPIEAALLENYRFDREGFQIPQSLFERTDMAQWLALDVATRAWSALDRQQTLAVGDSTAVIVANTLAGEFSRANLMRYRWPFVERVLRATGAETDRFIRAVEAAYKAPFPAPDEDSLAGALANTIAGRIANHHGLRGGAHTVDGACASSLVAITSAYEKLALGDLECAIVGAVDLSLDPFELVGFARNGALAQELMRIFDARSGGFWPGEGCGFLVLATQASVARRGWPVLGWIRGAGMSTDGAGSLTRPTANGQTLAASRAWRQAGIDPATADYFEAHGTGTAVGDPIELAGLNDLLGEASPTRPIPVGSIKANIGHTKAAAGMAGLLKALKVCQERIVPPTTGCEEPHLWLADEGGARLAVPAQAQRIAHQRPITVGVNSFGFGGVNCHVVVQGRAAGGAQASAPTWLPRFEQPKPAGELFMLHGVSKAELVAQLQQLIRRTGTLSRAQMADLAFGMEPICERSWRACVAADTPQQLESAAAAALASLASTANQAGQCIGDTFSWCCPREGAPRIVLVFPGQGITIDAKRPSPWAGRFPFLQDAGARASQSLRQDLSDTAVMQPLLAEVAMASVALLEAFEVTPSVVLGHSFGELSALYASGRIGSDDLRALATARGRCMRQCSPPGAMVAIHASHVLALEIAAKQGADVACENGQDRFVIAGTQAQMDAVQAECARRGIEAHAVPTARAFHSRLMAGARDAFAEHLSAYRWMAGHTPMMSTVLGGQLAAAQDLARLLTDQVVQPVRFSDALSALGEADLVVEAGSGPALRGLLEARFPGRTASLDVFSDSLAPLLTTLGSVWVLGGHLNRQPLFEGRMLRPCHLDDRPQFLSSPCGIAATDAALPVTQPPEPASEVKADTASTVETDAAGALRGVLSALTGLPAARVTGNLRLLADLHLNSIKARHAIALTAKRLGLAQLPFDLALLARATFDDAVVWLQGLQRGDEAQAALPAGVAAWLRLLTHEWTDIAQPAQSDNPAPSVHLHDELAPLAPACLQVLNISAVEEGAVHMLVLPAAPSVAVLHALLATAQRFTASAHRLGLLVLQGAQLANGFLRSVAAEFPDARICAVQYESLDATAVSAALLHYGQQGRGYSELRLVGTRWQTRRVTLAQAGHPERGWKPAPDDTVVFTGGGRGIGAAAAISIARAFRCKMAIIGRSPAETPDVAATLTALKECSAQVTYWQADLSRTGDAAAVVRAIETGLGPVKAIFHAAGINRPAVLAKLGAGELEDTVANKVGALANLLQAIPARQLHALVGFGSIIGEFGLAGEAHYALANEWLNLLLARTTQLAPQCLVLTVSWSAWRSLGMAARLEGVLQDLERSGIRPLETQEAGTLLVRLLKQPLDGPVIPCGRYGRAIDPGTDLRQLQRYRFLEQPRVYYPGIELIADARLSSDTDRYLQDHAPFGLPVLPLVVAIEAMVSAVQCVCASHEVPDIEDLKVNEAVTCELGQRFVMRTCALVLEDGTVLAEIRCETTGFEVRHFCARFRWGAKRTATEAEKAGREELLPAHPLLYDGLCFHGPRFRGVAHVTQARAGECRAITAPRSPPDWFSGLLPQEHVTGDAGLRDCFLHVLQLCIPQSMVLPVAVRSVRLGRLRSNHVYFIHGRQRFSGAGRYIFDISVCDEDGGVAEQWNGLELAQAVSAPAAGRGRTPLAPELLGPLLERVCMDGLGAHDVRAGVLAGEGQAATSEAAVAKALGRAVDVQRRADGAMLVAQRHATSSHAGELTIALLRRHEPVALDIQWAPGYGEEEWRIMLGRERSRLAAHFHEHGGASLQESMTLAWTVSECLAKLGIEEWPLARATLRRLETSHIGPVLIIENGGLRIAAGSVAVAGAEPLLSFAVAVQDVPALRDQHPTGANLATGDQHKSANTLIH